MRSYNAKMGIPDATYEIWLSDKYGFFERGVAHMADGRTLELKSWLHGSSFGQDSLLVDDEAYYTLGRFPLRWFIGFSSLDFYRVTPDTPDVIFHNETGAELRIDKYGVISNGATAEISPQQLRGLKEEQNEPAETV